MNGHRRVRRQTGVTLTGALLLVGGLSACGGTSADRANPSPSSATTVVADSVGTRVAVGTTPTSGSEGTAPASTTTEATSTTTTSSSTTTTVVTTTTTRAPAVTAAPPTTRSPTYDAMKQWFATNAHLFVTIDADDRARLDAGTNWTQLTTICTKYNEHIDAMFAALPAPDNDINGQFQSALTQLQQGVRRCIGAAPGWDYAAYDKATQMYLNPGINAFNTAVGNRNNYR